MIIVWIEISSNIFEWKDLLNRLSLKPSFYAFWTGTGATVTANDDHYMWPICFHIIQFLAYFAMVVKARILKFEKYNGKPYIVSLVITCLRELHLWLIHYRTIDRGSFEIIHQPVVVTASEWIKQYLLELGSALDWAVIDCSNTGPTSWQYEQIPILFWLFGPYCLTPWSHVDSILEGSLCYPANEVQGGNNWFHFVCLSFGLSAVCLSVSLSVGCPLCIFHNTSQIHFLFIDLIKHLQKVCHMLSFLTNSKIWFVPVLLCLPL